MIALVSHCVLLSTVTGGSVQTIKSHHYVVENTEGPILTMMPRNISGRVRIAMVGAMTTEQQARCRKMYGADTARTKNCLEFLRENHASYKTVQWGTVDSDQAGILCS